MIDVYSARWNEKHKLLSLLWKLQGDLVADVVPTFGTSGLLLSDFLMEKKNIYIPYARRDNQRFVYFFTPFWMVKNVC